MLGYSFGYARYSQVDQRGAPLAVEQTGCSACDSASGLLSQSCAPARCPQSLNSVVIPLFRKIIARRARLSCGNGCAHGLLSCLVPVLAWPSFLLVCPTRTDDSDIFCTPNNELHAKFDFSMHLNFPVLAGVICSGSASISQMKKLVPNYCLPVPISPAYSQQKGAQRLASTGRNTDQALQSRSY